MVKVGDNVCFIVRIESHNKNNFGVDINTSKLILQSGEIINKIINNAADNKLITYKIKSIIGNSEPGQQRTKYSDVESYYVFKNKDELIKAVNAVMYNTISEETIKKFKESDIFPVLMSSNTVDFGQLFHLLREYKLNKSKKSY